MTSKRDIITVYQKPTCSTCRQVMTILREMGADVEAINYYIEPIPAPKLKQLLKALGIHARDLLRIKEPLYKEMGLAGKDLTENEIIALMVKHPDLLQRPIVQRGTRAILARPAEKIRELFR